MPSVTVSVVPFVLVAMFWVVAGAIDVAELLMLMFVPLSLPFTVGVADTTRILYPVPVVVSAGIVALIDCDPLALEVTDCKIVGAANDPAALESCAVKMAVPFGKFADGV